MNGWNVMNCCGVKSLEKLGYVKGTEILNFSTCPPLSIGEEMLSKLSNQRRGSGLPISLISKLLWFLNSNNCLLKMMLASRKIWRT